jgi:hypothetical protein
MGSSYSIIIEVVLRPDEITGTAFHSSVKTAPNAREEMQDLFSHR